MDQICDGLCVIYVTEEVIVCMQEKMAKLNLS